MADATETQAPARKRRSPQPRSFDKYVILFSDGTYVLAECADLISKISEATKLVSSDSELTMEVRGMSKRIANVRQKAGGASRFDLTGEKPVVQASASKNSGLDITFED